MLSMKMFLVHREKKTFDLNKVYLLLTYELHLGSYYILLYTGKIESNVIC